LCARLCVCSARSIDIEVLSVVAQQLLTLQDAVRGRVTRLQFEGSEITVNPAYAAFITMNRAYLVAQTPHAHV